MVREIRIEGSTVFSADDLARVTAPYVGREVTAEDLEELRMALTRLYVTRGYLNSGAILPDQDVTGGVVTYRVIEGRLGEIEIEGQRWFRPGYLRPRLARGAGTPLNVNALQEQLQILLEDPRLRRLEADLRPGAAPGEATLRVTVEERPPYRLMLDANNHQAPSVGAERVILGFEHDNLTGYGDALTLRYGRSSGLDPLLDLRYAVPVTPLDTTLSLQYRRNAIVVVQPAFRGLDLESESEIYTVALRHPLLRTRHLELAVEASAERLTQETSILGRRFTLSPGARDGRVVVTALRAVQEAIHRTSDQVVAARSRFSVGIDALGATINPGGVPDGRFVAWLGQFQAVRRFPFRNVQALVRADIQLTGDRLPTLEQFPVGGRFSVRGYRENALVRDNAVVAALEVRVPVVENVPWAEFVHLAPFVDYGRGWNARRPRGEPQDLASVGLGLRWAVTIPAIVSLRPQLELYWGYGFRRVKALDHDLQDDGFHVQLVIGTM